MPKSFLVRARKRFAEISHGAPEGMNQWIFSVILCALVFAYFTDNQKLVSPVLISQACIKIKGNAVFF